MEDSNKHNTYIFVLSTPALLSAIIVAYRLLRQLEIPSSDTNNDLSAIPLFCLLPHICFKFSADAFDGYPFSLLSQFREDTYILGGLLRLLCHDIGWFGYLVWCCITWVELLYVG